MYKGKIVEHGPKELIYNNPLHPYTKLLKQASEQKLESLTSQDSTNSGCAFVPRCSYKQEICSQQPVMVEAEKGHFIACHLY